MGEISLDSYIHLVDISTGIRSTCKERNMSNVKVVDVIIRKTAEKTKLIGEGNLSVSIFSERD